MKTAVVYARYSSDNQTEQSIEGQLRVCEQYAKNNDILILNTYIDRAMTGTNDNRPAFQQMIKDSNKKEWNYVLVYKLDRFSRNRYENAIHKHTLMLNGTKLVSAMENIPDTPEGIILESMLEGINQYYSAELAQKIKRGMKETRLKGYFQGGVVPYGYKVENRKFVINEDEAEVVRFVYTKYSNGMYINQIIRELTSQNKLRCGKPFSTHTIYNMIRREAYTGIYRKENEIYENMFPPIISRELFEKVKRIRDRNHIGSRSAKNVYLLRNKLICGYCGKPISAECGFSKLGKKIGYYKCVGIKKYRNGCIKETVRQDVFEEFITNNIILELSKPHIMDEIVLNLKRLQNENSNESYTLKSLSKSKYNAEQSLQNIMKAVEQGLMNNTTNKRMLELEKDIQEYEKLIAIEKNKQNLIISEEEIRAFYTKALKQEPAILINYLINQIKVFNDKIEITFNSPIVKSPDNQGSLFLSITYNVILNKCVTSLNKPIKVNYYV